MKSNLKCIDCSILQSRLFLKKYKVDGQLIYSDQVSEYIIVSVTYSKTFLASLLVLLLKHKLSGLKQNKFIIQFWRSEVQNGSHCTKIRTLAGLCPFLEEVQGRIHFLNFSHLGKTDYLHSMGHAPLHYSKLPAMAGWVFLKLLYSDFLLRFCLLHWKILVITLGFTCIIQGTLLF